LKRISEDAQRSEEQACAGGDSVEYVVVLTGLASFGLHGTDTYTLLLAYGNRDTFDY